jgi:hypothetical protein
VGRRRDTKNKGLTGMFKGESAEKGDLAFWTIETLRPNSDSWSEPNWLSPLRRNTGDKEMSANPHS